MLTSLRLSGFRTFRSFSMEGLTRVNLLVGRNNVGKTAIMEGAEILLAGGEPWVLLRSPTRRNDGFMDLSGNRSSSRAVVDVLPLFHGHRNATPHPFEIEGLEGERRFVRCEIVPRPVEAPGQPILPGMEEANQLSIDEFSPDKALAIAGDRLAPFVLPLGAGQFLPVSALNRLYRDESSQEPVNFVDTRDPHYRLANLWDGVVLTPQEDLVVQAIRLVEPTIERIASVGSSGRPGAAPAMVVKVRGADGRVPVGTMGDGVRRLLTLSVNLVSAAGGKLFVDEIDTGLHYSALARMWLLIAKTARELDVQVFATTHSLDCLRALSDAFEASPEIGPDISVHRILRGAAESVRFGAEDLKTAIQQDMELR